MSPKTKIWLKRGLALVLFSALVYFFWPLLGEIKAAAELFRTADWIWLPIAVLVQLISYVSLTWLNMLALKPFPGKISFFTLAALLTSMAFIEIAVPSAGASGVALRVHLLGKFGYKSEEAIFSLGIETVTEVIAVISIAMIGLVYLLQAKQLELSQLVWLSLAGIIIFGSLWFAWTLIRSRDRSRALLVWLVNAWNRFLSRFRRQDLSQLEERLDTFHNHVSKYKEIPVWKFFLAAYGKVVLDIATLGAGFYLFRYLISPGTLLTGYSLMLVVNGAAVLPGGLGMTDAYVPVIFSWMAVPGAVSLAAGLTFRLITYWLMRFIGFISWQVLERR
jgi:uncharacterized protein (TIRG00374 family)